MREYKDYDSEKDQEKNGDDDILREARHRYAVAHDYYRPMWDAAREDLEFRKGEQWPAAVRMQRDAEMRPCLTANKIPQYVRQVTNELRQNMLSLRVAATSDGARAETAEVLKGLIKAIEYTSNAEVAYITAFESAVSIGFGYFRVVTEYETPMSFNQVIKIKRIRNPFSVMLDPASTQFDGSDADWGFIEDSVSKDEFKRKWPDAECSSTAVWANVAGDNKYKEWFTNESVKIVEYFRKVVKPTTIVQLETGQVVTKKIAEKLGAKFNRERVADVVEVEWYKINGYEVLERTVVVGSYIPVIPVYGTEIDIDNEITYEGIVRHAKDPQRAYNFWLSAETETIMAAPKTPIIGAHGQFDSDKDKWDTVNRRSYGYITYDPKTLNGSLLPPPYRLSTSSDITSITQARIGAVEDIKAATGIYTAALGAPSSEQTGKAINARIGQSSLNNAHYTFNLNIAYKHLGRIIMGMIPYIYDTPRILSIVGEDGDTQAVRVNQDVSEGERVDLTIGMYDVIVDAGPSFATQRRETIDAMMAWNQHFPRLSEIGGDIMARSMDWPGALELAKRFKNTLPPGVNGDNINVQQIMQENQMLKEQMQQLTQEADRIASNERIAADNNQTRMAIAELNSKVDLIIANKKGESNG